MPKNPSAKTSESAVNASSTEPAEPLPENKTAAPVEVGGRDGLDPVRYGDWEKGGRCIDF